MMRWVRQWVLQAKEIAVLKRELEAVKGENVIMRGQIQFMANCIAVQEQAVSLVLRDRIEPKD